jgi:hypothetical protein
VSDEIPEFSEVAIEQMDALEAGPDMDLYNAVLEAVDLIFDRPREAQRRSTAINGNKGVVLRLPVMGFPPYKVFWTSEGPSIEAVFPHS